MLRLAIIESSAEQRNQLHSFITKHLESKVDGINLIPKISVNSVNSADVQYHSEPEVCIVGQELASNSPDILKNIREVWKHTALIVQLDNYSNNITSLDAFARLGIDDIITQSSCTSELLGKFLIHARRQKEQNSGKLILIDSGKGGQGVTSLSVAIAESLLEKRKRVLLIDFDNDTQDLSRYLKVRPYYNENLTELLKQTKAITKETVEDCLTSIDGTENFCCLTPADSHIYYQQDQETLRTFLSIFTYLDESFDYIVVDPGQITPQYLSTIYRLADQLVYVVGNDPASLYPTVAKFKKIWPQLAVNHQTIFIENAIYPKGLSSKILQSQIANVLNIENIKWFGQRIKYNQRASYWPGSGYSLYSLANRSTKKIFDNLAKSLKTIEENHNVNQNLLINAKSAIPKLLPFFRNKAKELVRKQEEIIIPSINSDDSSVQEFVENQQKIFFGDLNDVALKTNKFSKLEVNSSFV